MLFRKNKEYKGEEKKELTFWEHLEELRARIIRIIIVFLSFSVIAFLNKHFIFNTIILAPTKPAFITNRFFCHMAQVFNLPEMCINAHPIKLISINMSGQFVTHMNISAIAGLIIATPYLIWEIWQFLVPALKPNERKNISRIVIISSILFFVGILFSYYMIVPLTIDFFATYHVSEQVENQINLNSFISSISSITLATGIIFELPIFSYFLTKIGVLTTEKLKSLRKYAIIIVLCLAAILTPPDVFSQLLVSIPLYLLYEFSILISKSVSKSKEKEIVSA
jgi:sec-independent protein translocase protein TatC